MGKEIDLSSGGGSSENKIDKVQNAENYIPKFKADGNLDKSSIYEVNNKIGIRTDTPQSSLLHIKQGASGGTSFKNTTTLIETSGSSNLYQALKISTRGNIEALNVTNAGRVGIGIKIPNVSLAVKNKDGDNKYETMQSITSSGGSLLEFRDMDNIKVDFGSVHGNPVIRTKYNIHFKMIGDGSREGYIGFNVSDPKYRLELPNDNSNSGRGRANAWSIYSDSRLKLKQKELNYGLNEVLKMQPKSFIQYGGSIDKGKVKLEDNGANSIGLIAQELKDIIPEAVHTPSNEKEDFYSIDYNKLVPVLINALKELKQEIEELKAKNAK